MGYRTYRTIERIGQHPADCPEIIDEAMQQALAEITDYTADCFTGGEECKWYNADEDMLEFSRVYPDVTFRMFCQGEDSLDIYVCWYKNGAMQRWDLDTSVPTQPPEPWPC